MSKTSIEWCDHSINPIRARLNPPPPNMVLAPGEQMAGGHYCEKISPGCTNCYASRLQPRFGMPVFETQRRLNVESYLDEGKLAQVLKRKTPTRYFWCDMSDLFGAWVPDEWIDRCFAVMALTPQHTHLVLTKRSERMREYFSVGPDALTERWAEGFSYLGIEPPRDDLAKDAMRDGADLDETESALWERAWSGICNADVPLPNVWAGVSVEDVLRKSRMVDLRATPAAVRFVSFEPLLEDLGLLDLTGIQWVIAGGENGPRPCALDWIRSIVQQADAQGAAPFVKQLGVVPMELDADWRARPTLRLLNATNGKRVPDGWVPLKLYSRKGADPSEWPADLRVREFPRSQPATT